MSKRHWALDLTKADWYYEYLLETINLCPVGKWFTERNIMYYTNDKDGNYTDNVIFVFDNDKELTTEFQLVWHDLIIGSKEV